MAEHRADHCSCCGAALIADLPAEKVSLHKLVELPEVALAERVTRLAASTLLAKRQALERQLADILASARSCDLTRALQARISRARDQLLTFLDHPGLVETTNNACERALRPAVIQRKVTNGYRVMWAARGEAAVCTVVETARLTPGATVFGTILATVSARNRR